MARITVEDCLEQIPNRFSLVLVAAERTKQLLRGEQSLISDDRSNKEAVTALREIAAGMVVPDLSQFDENMMLQGQLATRSNASQESHDSPMPTMDFDDDLPPEADDD